MKLHFDEIPSGQLLRDCYPDEGETELVIPEGVVGICPSALRRCQNITCVHLPATLNLHDGEVFSTMTSLEDILVSRGNPRLFSRDGVLYSRDAPSFIRLLRYPAGRQRTIYTVGTHVDAIGKYAFSNTVHLCRLSLSESVRDVGECAFSACKALSSVSVRGRLNYIRERAFSFCPKLKHFSLYALVEHVEAHAFLGCTSLADMYFLHGLLTLGEGAFALCAALENIILPDTVTFISHDVFYGCESLKSIRCSKEAAAFIPQHHDVTTISSAR